MSDAMTSPTPAERAKQLLGILQQLQCGTCNCTTKTPAIEYHSVGCRYRLAVEAEHLLEALAAAPQAQQASALGQLLADIDSLGVNISINGGPISERKAGWNDCLTQVLEFADKAEAAASSPSPAQSPVEAEPALCECKDRPADQCPGTWEPGCDMGANEKFVRVSKPAQGLSDEQIDALMPTPDGSAEVNVQRIEVLPGLMGTEYEEADAWSRPLVLQIVRAALASKPAAQPLSAGTETVSAPGACLRVDRIILTEDGQAALNGTPAATEGEQ